MPSVSIVIPVYNGIRTLHRPLEALRKQSLKDIEIIIVDDCSDDGSLAWADKFLRNGAVPYKVLSLNCHGGVSAARNLGMKEAAGDCVFFLDADDYIEKTCLEKLYSLFCDDENVDVAFCGFRRVNVLGEVLQQYFPRKKYLNHAVSGTEALNLFWKSKIDLHMTSCMVRRSFLFEKSVFFYDGC
ncbi:MAG: glycosyltransferase family A protein, partial [Proteiniphilum sp.]|nr:glycosyltransferase family A protein [Proteiniphilum sp.]